MPFISFLTAQRGRSGSFFVRLPGRGANIGVGGGNALVNGAGMTGDYLDIVTTEISTIKYLARGDLISIDGRLKVYQVLDQVDTASDGTATIHLFPALLSAPSVGASVATTDIVFVMSLKDDTFSFSVSGASEVGGLSFDLEEASEVVDYFQFLGLNLYPSIALPPGTGWV